MDGGRGGGGGEREAQRGGVGFAVAGGLGREDEVAEGELVDLVEARSGEEQGAVAGVEFDGGDVGGLGEGARGELVGAGLVVLLDGEMEVAGGEVVLLRQCKREPIRVVVIGVGLKGDVEFGVAAGGTRADGVHARGSGGGEQELGGVAGDEVGGVVVRGDDLPAGAGELLQWDRGALIGIKAPAALDGSGEQDGGQAGLESGVGNGLFLRSRG